jgi:hypothetical protein
MSGVVTDAAWGGHAGWAGDRNRQPEPTATPDMAALIDGEEPDDGRAAFELAGEIMRGVFAHVFDGEKDATGQPRLDVAFRRFVCVAWLLRPELLGNVSLAQLAPQLGVTKAALSQMIRKFGDAHGIRNVFQKREGAREAYSEAQKRDHWRRRGKAPESEEPVAPQETTGPDEHSLNEETHHPEDSA